MNADAAAYMTPKPVRDGRCANGWWTTPSLAEGGICMEEKRQTGPQTTDDSGAAPRKITLSVRSSVKAGLMQCCTKSHHCAGLLDFRQRLVLPEIARFQVRF